MPGGTPPGSFPSRFISARGEEEGESRFGALVPVDPVLWRNRRNNPRWPGGYSPARDQVTAEEPLGRRPRSVSGSRRDRVTRYASRQAESRRVCLDRVAMIEPGSLVPLAVEPVAADRRKCSREPWIFTSHLERLQAHLQRPALPVSRPPAIRLWRTGDVVAEDPRTTASLAWLSGRRCRAGGRSACREPGWRAGPH